MSRKPAPGEEVQLLTGNTATIKQYMRDLTIEARLMHVVMLQKPCRQEFAYVADFERGLWLEQERAPNTLSVTSVPPLSFPDAPIIPSAPSPLRRAQKPVERARKGCCPRCGVVSAPGNAHVRVCRVCGQEYGSGVLSTQLKYKNSTEVNFWHCVRVGRGTWFGRLALRVLGLHEARQL